MRHSTRAYAALAIGAIASLNFKPGLAADECIRVVGYEWDGEKQTADPARFTSTDGAYHIYGIYEGLVDLDNDWQPIARLAKLWEF